MNVIKKIKIQRIIRKYAPEIKVPVKSTRTPMIIGPMNPPKSEIQ